MKISSFSLKSIGFLSITCYSVAYSGLISNQWIQFILSTIGTLCLPIFAFLIEEAYQKTGNLTKLMTRSLIVALVAAFPYRYAFYAAKDGWLPQSFFSGALTSFCCIGLILFYDKMKTKNQRIFCLAFVCALSMLIGMEFAPYALIIVAIIHLTRDKKFFEMAYYIASFLIVIAAVNLFMLKFTDYADYSQTELLRNISLFGGVFALPLLKKFDGTKGPSNKLITFGSYAFYPLMLAVICFIKLLP